MRSRRTPSSNFVYRLGGGTEDNDLHVQRAPAAEVGEHPDSPVAGLPAIVSVWEPSPEERAALACGANIELRVIGELQPPVSVNVTREQPLSRPQRSSSAEPAVWFELSASGLDDVLQAISWYLQAAPNSGREGRLAVFRTQLEELEVALGQQEGDGS